MPGKGSCRRGDTTCKNIETLTDAPGSKSSDDSRGTEGKEEPQVKVDERPTTRLSSGWTRDRNVTRSISKKTGRHSDADKGVDTQDIVNTVVEPDPRKYGEAMMSQLKDKLLVVITEELTALEDNGVWATVVPPLDSHVLHNKGVFKTKTDANGNVEWYKARLVA